MRQPLRDAKANGQCISRHQCHLVESADQVHHQPEAVVLDFVNPISAAFLFNALRFWLRSRVTSAAAVGRSTEMQDLRQLHCPISTPMHCKKRVATAWGRLIRSSLVNIQLPSM